MLNPVQPPKKNGRAAGAPTPTSTCQGDLAHEGSALRHRRRLYHIGLVTKKTEKQTRGHRLLTKAACQRLGFQALRVLLLLRDANASYQDLLDIVRGG